MPGWTVRRLRPTDPDLGRIVDQINGAAMEMGDPFTVDSLRAFLAGDEAVYLTVHANDRLAGTLHAVSYLHPAGKRYVYVDEVDTDLAFRRQGVAAAMMKAIFDVARELGAAGVWLGSDDGRDPAHALYRSLSPTDVEPGVVYTWEFD